MWTPCEVIPVFPETSTAGFVFHQMPSYLSADRFSEWYNRICDLAKSIGLIDPVASDLKVTFSDKIKTRTFGSWSVEEAKEKIRESWDINEYANARLNEIHTPEDCHEGQFASSLAEAISAANRDRNETYKSVREQLEDIFSMVAFERLVLGEYVHPKSIILYTKNIEQTQRTTGEKRTLEQIYEEVFAHEMFHAYHYQNDPEELTERKDYTSRVVKESLAAAFEWEYCVVYKNPNADNLRYAWDQYSVISYPYSGAKRLLQPVPHKAMVELDKVDFCDIFHTSLEDMDRALRDLIPTSFYSIKNMIFYREKVIKLPATGPVSKEGGTKYSAKRVGLTEGETHKEKEMKQTFKDFLIGPLTKESADSYISYAENAFKKMMHTEESIFSFLEPYKHTARERFCENLVAMLNDEIDNPLSEHTAKTLKNYKSAITKLGVFFEQRIYRKQGTKDFTKAIVSAYTYKDLVDNFLFRMETQDRVYLTHKCCFPCRLFQMIFKKNSTYKNTMKDTIDATMFVTYGGSFALSQVEKLEINKGTSTITVHGISYDIYTEVYKKGLSYGFQKATAKTLPELSLDHDTPMVKLVVDNIDKLPELKRLSDAFIAFKNASGLDGSKLSTQFYKTVYPHLMIDESKLLNDIAVIFKDIHLTIMEKKYNSSKNKHITE